MAGDVCYQHAASAAAFRCDGCDRLLCEACAEESHALYLCRACGERALPLGGEPAVPRDRRRRVARAAPYSLGSAIFFPFRGYGPYLLVAALLSLLFLRFIPTFGCVRMILLGFFWALMAGLQFKIVHTTVDGENELPDWPDYTDVRARVFDLLTFSTLYLMSFAPLAGFLYLMGADSILTLEPSVVFWAGFSLCAWLGVAMTSMAYGAAGAFYRLDALRVDRHIQAFVACGADAIQVTNIVFVMAIFVLLVRAAVSAAVPVLGYLASEAFGIYWFFTSPHLMGVVFRRNADAVDAIYRPETAA